MSSQNVELVRAGFEALSEGDVEALLPFIHPEFEVTTPANLAAEPDTYRGHEGVRRYFDSFYDAMDEIRFEPQEFREAGGRVIVAVTLRARGRTTGIETTQEFAMAWSLRDRKAVRVEVYGNLDEALEATED
ncbi:MAG: nuclear transport factor 2 family protein [Actinomycetota bacterium]